MNDFTKDELKKILDSLENDFSCAWVGDEVISKIQSLIDNYCEHEYTENIGGWVSKCLKCSMKFGDETQ